MRFVQVSYQKKRYKEKMKSKETFLVLSLKNLMDVK